MTGVIFPLAGGIGLFLLSMALLSDGLKAFAGDSLRRALVQFTGSPIKAFASGALATTLTPLHTASINNSGAAAETHPKRSTETSISINNQGTSL